jgi:hypothetical protein
MKQSEFIQLKTGDKVIYNDTNGFQLAPRLTVLTRKEGWLDDEDTANFTFITPSGGTDHHFFSAEELDLIKE